MERRSSSQCEADAKDDGCTPQDYGPALLSPDCCSHGLGDFEVRTSRAYRHFRFSNTGGPFSALAIMRLELYGSIMSPEAETDEAPRKRARV